ncbi:bifunctional phosphopantothenoylcysteine decarboxylase/phosphopantothenate--cysteine ligase CoaBC [Pseudobacteroides cellulosolvens]|uniref:Coenzyme A biosynthesis bifunctional protein CoaBC n=1 Tax=Pseudobacteroides cellulosolvens ATCC 35603 = DSM 2933 TaxID=398512 RepID=A0A0L6JN33_9FIRM|nr:bifunctional phosphopantothenoylcysteine decarboxylase/phosphopantothenate--cysteine ligase CoaBC [Pseudobacteroides cellulosolvens]KNY26787.1 phosphopantothenoylcysteine decarboxylase/phosphopantothenate/cysteine ligase [Pseudobacteroides cellulosolvens ATCC 35603 = DSM 2933]
MLNGINIVLGVCGGIAAYKSVEIVSRLKKLDAEVNVIMTESAQKFVAPLTFRSISRNPVITDMFQEPVNYDIKHISLAQKADLLIVAPATANIIGKIANGIADDMLTTTVMATKAKVLIVPAMNVNMYENVLVKDNIEKLKRLGYMFMEPATGMLACGINAKGRMPEPEEIVDMAVDLTINKGDMGNIKILVTAGPTREAIDPVRYITNHSSGKMGYAIAKVAKKRGACVSLVTGPVNIERPENVNVFEATTADDMFQKVNELYESADIIIMAAAVADYKCSFVSNSKIKKSSNELTLTLVKNPDIAYSIGGKKGDRVLVGFAAETNDIYDNAKSKLSKKNMDMIVANDVTMEGAGFNHDTNIVSIILNSGEIIKLPIMTKEKVANEILNYAVRMYNDKRSSAFKD